MKIVILISTKLITEKNINCHNCNILSNCRYGTQLYQTPEILINILKRDLNSFINVELDFMIKLIFLILL